MGFITTIDNFGLELFESKDGHHHSILVGSKCAYCMECGQIIIEYKNKNNFKRLMNPGVKDLE